MSGLIFFIISVILRFGIESILVRKINLNIIVFWVLGNNCGITLLMWSGLSCI